LRQPDKLEKPGFRAHIRRMSLHIAHYEIVLAPAGLVVLAAFVAVLVFGVVAIVRMVQRRARP
jgi:hypothetical protein